MRAKKPGRGGKREGAGRPSKYGEPTETIRLPVVVCKWLKDPENLDKLRQLMDS